MITNGSRVEQPAMNETSAPVLAVEDLTVEVPVDRIWRPVVEQVSFSVRKGETLGLVGESGSGKTMTSLAVMGLLSRNSARIAHGSIRLTGQELVGAGRRQLDQLRGDRIAMIFQEPMTSLNPSMKIGEQIVEAVRRHRPVSRAEARRRAVEVLDLVGVPSAASRVNSYPHEFSGGMRQRAMIAMSLACDPDVLIADEPTTALDVTIQAQILDLLRQMRDELGLALLFITHSMGVVADICDRVAVMYHGQVVEQADADDLFERPRHPYTEGLLRAMPTLVVREGRLPLIPGRPPQATMRPTGCAFSPRCPYRIAACTEVPPALFSTGDTGVTRCIRPGLPLQGAT
ncbi:ABC transporter ATP-binding protein [Pseudonocardia asaccharolytica]|uniref:ABC transporter ATP-binding protein n=1 Tax=Pseudonocardia asaccharolytica DSM 44247 = NBRC 16224 TaxID=1123024 RepID=A0A511CXD7_9PSEU|nr:ABC transporter ATP-binding protein [Pseudonocardia asaccharolytica]GEL17226.1 ABC transporter ATP-binding protein [Pseudonocardia asaccharolytica DSM 44247 = NBRC 16224]